MVVRLQKGRRSVDVFACLKVLVELLKKLARVKAASPPRRRTGETSFSAFLFAKLFLCACGVKEKAVLDSGEVHGYR